mmetsp:Transcript_9089/g.13272  ORF Transcript_9089/g.13272 Transcript_9089/m.13272 type:complete len:96 (-) Transcript_9089:1603-1890(-)
MDEEEVGTVQDKDPRYPIQVLYCAVCGMPPELCEYNTPQDFERYEMDATDPFSMKHNPWLRLLFVFDQWISYLECVPVEPNQLLPWTLFEIVVKM